MPAFATETEMVILRGRVEDLKDAVDAMERRLATLEAENAELRQIVKAMRDGVWLSRGDHL
jgi:uncharacterized protein YhaN